MAAKKEVARTEENLPATVDGMFDLKENMESVEARLPQIDIVHQGQMFKMPDGTKTEGFMGIILDMNRANAWWETSFDKSGGGSPPDCYSLDGVTLDPMSEKPQSPTGACRECPQNRFGSDGRGKACKNMKRVHIWIDGYFLPYRLTVPPSSIRAVDSYVSLLISSGTPYQLAITEFALKEVSNKDGIAYSELVMKTAGKITDRKKAEEIKKVRADFINVMRGQPIEAEEYMPQD